MSNLRCASCVLQYVIHIQCKIYVNKQVSTHMASIGHHIILHTYLSLSEIDLCTIEIV